MQATREELIECILQMARVLWRAAERKALNLEHVSGDAMAAFYAIQAANAVLLEESPAAASEVMAYVREVSK